MVEKVTNFMKFRLVLWKNFVLEKSHMGQFICEIFMPIIFALILIWARSEVDAKTMPPRHYEELEVNDMKAYIENTIGKLPQPPVQILPEFTFAYSPQNAIIRDIVKGAQERLSLTNQDPRGFADAKEMERNLMSKNEFITAIEFDDSYSSLQEVPEKLAFKLRFPSELRSASSNPGNVTTWETDKLYPQYQEIGPRNPMAIDDGVPAGYFQEGFIAIQHAIVMSYLTLSQKQNAKEYQLPEIVMQRFPYPEYIYDGFPNLVRTFLPSVFKFSFLSFVTIVTKKVAEEKEKQLKEIMKMLGIPNWIHWLAWFVRSMVIMGLAVILMLIMYTIPFTNNVAIFTHAHWTIIFAFLIIYSITVITFSFMMSVFFKRATTAAVVAALVFYFAHLPVGFIETDYADMSAISKALVCLDLNIGMTLAIRIIVGWEGTGEGAHWDNLFDPVNADDNLSLGVVFLVMLLAALIYLIICLYVEQVFPGQFGVSRKWNFFFKREFWSAKKTVKHQDERYTQFADGKSNNSPAFEKEPKNKHIGVEIKGLKKKFGDKWVVKGVTLNMFEDEITVLLGHNGAGKTTTISMLTGMITPTAGMAKINGYDIRTNIESARLSLGICPQINVLFDDMSVADHLRFFSKLKGVSGKAVKSEVDRYLHVMQLTKKAKALSKTLSGGMKRKLTLCNALCGGTKVVFCDEPSSGMDPAARRQLWDLMQAEKIGRTMLLTTHFMDEADVLGDRIAIMCDGEIKCCGSPFYLKEIFGSGYHLICVKGDNCDVDGVTQLLDKYIPGIQPENEIGTELTYCLPDEYLNMFGNIFTDLEEEMKNLGLNGFGVGITSLEEVFMKVGAENANPAELAALKTKKLKKRFDDSKLPNESEDPRSKGGADKNPNEDKNGENEKQTEGKKRSVEENESDASFYTARQTLTESESDFRSTKNETDAVRKSEPSVPVKVTKTNEKEATDKEAESDMAVANKGGTKESEALNLKEDISDDGDAASKEREAKAEEERRKSQEAREEAARIQAAEELKRIRAAEKKAENYQNQRLHFEVVENESQKSLQTRRSFSWNQWHAMFYKKAIYSKRNFFIYLVQCIFGIVFIIFAAELTVRFGLKDLPPRILSLAQYPQAVTYIEKTTAVQTGSTLDLIGDKYQQIVGAHGKEFTVETLTETDGKGFEELIYKLSSNNQVEVNKNYLTAATIDIGRIKIWFNNQPFHMAPLALNLIHNAMAKVVLGDDAKIEVTNYPFSYTSVTRLNNIESNGFNSSMGITLGFVLAFISALYAIPVIQEATTRCKVLQFVSGVRVWTYWLTHYLWDLLTLILTVIVLFICLACFQLEGYATFLDLGKFFLFTLVFCMGALPLTYFLSRFFHGNATGFAIIFIIYFFSGIFLFVTYVIVEAVMKALNESPPTRLHKIFSLSPHFSFVNGWFELSKNIKTRIACNSDVVKTYPPQIKCRYLPMCCDIPPYLGMKSPGIFWESLGIVFIGVLCFVAIMFFDAGYTCIHMCSFHPKSKYKPGDDVDDDVFAEREKVRKLSARERTEHYLVVDNLAKYYGKFLAVNYLSLSVKGKECFGLLGVNGAGKTTTFRMLTGDHAMSSGHVYVRGTSLRAHKLEVYRKIGYCPQFDALLEDLTGRETMFIFCLLRGIPADRIKTTTEELAKALGFLKHLDKRSANYSGGNKRKLSTAIALVGAPSVIYLDEPTAGLDPAARRQLWNIICLVRDHGKLIVLTSHSMDECEALCTRLAIMVNGEFKCIGSTQHLKNKFSKGLVLKVSVERILDTRNSIPGSSLSLEMRTNINRIKEAVFNKYPSAVLQSEYQTLLTIYIPLTVIKWSEIFLWIEQNRVDLKIADYSISQTTLEEIFLEFANTQHADKRVTGRNTLDFKFLLNQILSAAGFPINLIEILYKVNTTLPWMRNFNEIEPKTTKKESVSTEKMSLLLEK